MDKLRIGMIGCGHRGKALSKLIAQDMPDIEIVAICDPYEDKMEVCRGFIEEGSGKSPVMVTDYRRILEMKDVDAIISPSAWEAHAEIAVNSMLAGKYVGIEVGGAYSLEQCWDIVRTHQRTGVPCMMLENCCYGKEELTVLNMIRKGIFGEVVHCEGGYCHDLREEAATGAERRHYRLRNYMYRNGEVYPTHELGPIAKYLNINRGNRMTMLTSMASKSAGLHHWINEKKGPDYNNANHSFAMGDVVTTCIKCANGETITLTHDTTLPRPYSRANKVQGTKGIWMEDTHGVYLPDLAGNDRKHAYRNLDELLPEFLHPIWEGYEAVGGHGGMDFLVLKAFFEAVRNGTDTPIDAYDTAAWMSITPLSEQSIACGSMPVAIPDFTEGKWTHREPAPKAKYALD